MFLKHNTEPQVLYAQEELRKPRQFNSGFFDGRVSVCAEVQEKYMEHLPYSASLYKPASVPHSGRSFHVYFCASAVLGRLAQRIWQRLWECIELLSQTLFMPCDSETLGAFILFNALSLD